MSFLWFVRYSESDLSHLQLEFLGEASYFGILKKTRLVWNNDTAIFNCHAVNVLMHLINGASVFLSGAKYSK